MRTTLAEYRQQMLTMDSPEDLGEVHTLASVTAQSVTVTRKATGVVSSDRYEGRFLLRPFAANVADREPRVVTGFDSASGTFSHEGRAYVDEDAEDELIEIHQYDPRLLDEAINYTIGKLRYEDVTEIPGVWGGGRHWLNNLPWIEKPGDVTRITRTASPVLSRNRYFDKWGAYDGSGNLVPDAWENGGAARILRANPMPGLYMEYGLPGAVFQSIPMPGEAVSGESLQGKKVTFYALCITDAQDDLRLMISSYPGGPWYSPYHPGDGMLCELSVTMTVPSDAPWLGLRIESEQNFSPPVIRQACLVYGEVDDAVRRDSYAEEVVYDCGFEQSSSLPVMLPPNFGRSYRIHSLRAYPQFPADMVRDGVADQLESEAPLLPVATGALFHLYSRLAQRRGEDTTRYSQIAAEWRTRWETLASRHPYVPNRGGGMPLRPRLMALPARRY